MNAGECPTRRATYQDVIDAPAHRVAEIVDARVYVSPRAPPLAALAKTCLSAVLGRAFGRGRDGPGGWWLFHGLCCKPDERARWSGREMCPP